MAETINKYFGTGGISVANNFDISVTKPIDSRFTVANSTGLTELKTEGRVYEGLIAFNEADKKYYQYVNGDWKELVVNSLDELKTLIASETTASMVFKGAITDGTLPTEGEKGDMYKVATTNITIPAPNNVEGSEVIAKPGDSIVYEGDNLWYLIPSGDDIEDTWRPVKVGDNELEGNEALEFIAGNNVTITEEGGKVTISSTDTDTHHEAKIVIGNDSADVTTNENVENGNVHLNLVENGELRSSHKIVGTGGAKVTHLPKGTEIYGDDGILVETVDADTIYVDTPTQLDIIPQVVNSADEGLAGILTFDTGILDETSGTYPSLVIHSNDIIKTVVENPMGKDFDIYQTPGSQFGFWDENGEKVEDFTQDSVKDYIDLALENKMDKIAIGEGADYTDCIPTIGADGNLVVSNYYTGDLVTNDYLEEVIGSDILNRDEPLSVQGFVEEFVSSSLEGYVPVEHLGFYKEESGYISNAQPIEGFTTVKDYIDNKELNVEKLTQTENTYIVFNCGSASTVI